MPVRTIVDRMIESSTHGNGGILLDGTDVSSSNAGSFLVLDASAASTVDVNERIEYEQETIAVSNIEQPTITQLEDSSRFDFISLERERTMETPTIKRNKGKTRSVGVAPCHSACLSGAYT